MPYKFQILAENPLHIYENNKNKNEKKHFIYQIKKHLFFNYIVIDSVAVKFNLFEKTWFLAFKRMDFMNADFQ